MVKRKIRQGQAMIYIYIQNNTQKTKD